MSLNNLAKFEAKNKIKDAIMTFIVTQLSSSQDIKDAKEAFRMLDQNGDGKLSILELLNGYKSVNLDPEVIDKIMARVDTDSNGYIDYTEFLKAAIDIKKLASNINLKIAFETFDKDGSGKISPDELRYALLGENEGEDSI